MLIEFILLLNLITLSEAGRERTLRDRDISPFLIVSLLRTSGLFLQVPDVPDLFRRRRKQQKEFVGRKKLSALGDDAGSENQPWNSITFRSYFVDFKKQPTFNRMRPSEGGRSCSLRCCTGGQVPEGTAGRRRMWPLPLLHRSSDHSLAAVRETRQARDDEVESPTFSSYTRCRPSRYCRCEKAWLKPPSKLSHQNSSGDIDASYAPYSLSLVLDVNLSIAKDTFSSRKLDLCSWKAGDSRSYLRFFWKTRRFQNSRTRIRDLDFSEEFWLFSLITHRGRRRTKPNVSRTELLE